MVVWQLQPECPIFSQNGSQIISLCGVCTVYYISSHNDGLPIGWTCRRLFAC